MLDNIFSARYNTAHKQNVMFSTCMISLCEMFMILGAAFILSCGLRCDVLILCALQISAAILTSLRNTITKQCIFSLISSGFN